VKGGGEVSAEEEGPRVEEGCKWGPQKT